MLMVRVEVKVQAGVLQVFRLARAHNMSYHRKSNFNTGTGYPLILKPTHTVLCFVVHSIVIRPFEGALCITRKTVIGRLTNRSSH